MNPSVVRLYTLPGCIHCNTLKEWLKKESIAFEENPFDTDAQVDFIMQNIFSDPPILKVDAKIFTPQEIFNGDELVEGKLRELLDEAKKQQ